MRICEYTYQITYGDKMVALEEFFYLLSDETQLRCLTLLQLKDGCCVCGLAAALQVKPSKILKHLVVLKGLDIIFEQESETWIYYSLHPNLPLWFTRILSVIAKEATRLYSWDLVRFNIENSSHC